MDNINFIEILSWFGLIVLLLIPILYHKNKSKKENNRRIETLLVYKSKPWWQKTYIWEVFFKRAFYRPWASSFPYIIFIIPTLSMMFDYGLFYSNYCVDGPPIPLQKMEQVAGIVTKAHRGTGRGAYDSIRVKYDNNNEYTYRLCCFNNKEAVEEFEKKIIKPKKRVTVWYREEGLIFKTKHLFEMKASDKYIRLDNQVRFKYRYAELKHQYAGYTFENWIWWIKYSLAGWLWLWFLNKKELPIHRLNRMRYYKKYLKDK